VSAVRTGKASEWWRLMLTQEPMSLQQKDGAGQENPSGQSESLVQLDHD
jgi:hypothetical protein